MPSRQARQKSRERILAAMTKTDELMEMVKVISLAAIMGAALLFALRSCNDEKRECERKGGRIVSNAKGAYGDLPLADKIEPAVASIKFCLDSEGRLIK